MATNYSEAEVKKAHEILFNEGLKMRYQVAGKEYVDRSLENGSGPFASAMQEVRLPKKKRKKKKEKEITTNPTTTTLPNPANPPSPL